MGYAASKCITACDYAFQLPSSKSVALAAGWNYKQDTDAGEKDHMLKSQGSNSSAAAAISGYQFAMLEATVATPFRQLLPQVAACPCRHAELTSRSSGLALDSWIIAIFV